jgi:Transposase domain (DUF772)/Zincin-like metallopeptidase
LPLRSSRSESVHQARRRLGRMTDAVCVERFQSEVGCLVHQSSATLAEQTGFQRYSKKTRRALFLEEMEHVVPWGELCSLAEPHYPKAGNGRRPVGVERMLRVYFLQQWFSLSDPAVEEALYDSPLMRRFAQIDLGNIEAVCSTEAEIREQIRRTIIHEFGHYFGMDEEQLKNV